MALNLSTLTSPATSGEVLAEALTTADFLEPVPVLRNLARGSQKGGDAKQGTALNQPRALPLIDGDGYCYTSGINGNYASLGATVLPATANFDLSIDFVFKGPVTAGLVELFYQYDSGAGRFIMGINDSNELRVFWGPVGGRAGGTIIEGQKHTARLVRSGSNFTLSLDGTSIQTWTSSAAISQVPSLLGYGVASNRFFKGGIFKVTEGSNYACDFTATNVRHGQIKFRCATNQVVTINTSGLNPAKIIKRSVLRFDGTNDGLRGVFANNIDGGYMFAAFSVLGDGGSSYARMFSVNANGSSDSNTNGFLYGFKYASTNDLAAFGANADLWSHTDMYDDERGDILYEAKAKSGGLISKVNNANKFQLSTTLAISSNEFNVGNSIASLAKPAAIDLEFLALFSNDSVPDEATAKRIRDYINGRGVHPIFSLIDSAAYYFYDATKAPSGAISSGSSAWSGRVVGSDNGDSASLLATQSTSNDAPVSDGYTVTFADNTDHLDIPSTSQSGYQIVGTSLGTFCYLINGTTAVTELNLLGSLGHTAYRKTGDLYGIILLPASATGADIEQSRKLLIDRGAADGASGSNYYAAWFQRFDIVEFQNVSMATPVNLNYAFSQMSNLVSFPAMTFTNTESLTNTWELNTSMSDFGAIQAPLCSNFFSAWKGTSALTSFPAGAKLGTEANNVNFTEAWRESGLTSFNTDLPTGTNFTKTWRQSDLVSFGNVNLSSGTSFNASWQQAASLVSFGAVDARNGTNFQEAFRDCAALKTIEDGVLLGTASSSVDFTSAFKHCTALTTLPSNLDLSKGDDFQTAFQNCQSLVNFPANAFDTMGTPQSYCFLNTWLDTNALSAASVENILVSINTCGQSAPSTGPEITIKYNTATGTPAYSTLASLKSKGWVVIVNGVTL